MKHTSSIFLAFNAMLAFTIAGPTAITLENRQTGGLCVAGGVRSIRPRLLSLNPLILISIQSPRL